MTMTMANASSSSSSKRGGLRGPRPQPLKVSSSSARGSSPSSSRSTKKLHGSAGAASPVIVYEYTPKIVHARPQEFMTVVQRLTGKPVLSPPTGKPVLSPPLPTTSTYAPAVQEGAGDPLLLTLGQRQAVPLPPVPSPKAAGIVD